MAIRTELFRKKVKGYWLVGWEKKRMRLLLFVSFYILYSSLTSYFFRLGPLLPETRDVRTIPVRQRREITINLSGKRKYINLKPFREIFSLEPI